jgi:hypothetical protein
MYEGMSLWVWMQLLIIKYDHAWPNIPNFLGTKSFLLLLYEMT